MFNLKPVLTEAQLEAIDTEKFKTNYVSTIYHDDLEASLKRLSDEVIQYVKMVLKLSY